MQKSISTLHPDRLQPGDFTDISAKGRHDIRTSFGSCTQISYSQKDGFIPFPPSTHGFFYYHRDPLLPPVAGEVRFRITRSQDPASFRTGHDLLRPSRRPWSIPLLSLTALRGPAALREQLVADGIVDQALLLKCEQLVKGIRWTRTPSIALYSLDQPFIAHLDHPHQELYVVGADAIGRCQMQGIFGSRPSSSHSWRAPYTG